jgi:3-methyladenine DNA glycosylase AlkD
MILSDREIRAIAKKIKTDHQLALNLWDTGNVEAQVSFNRQDLLKKFPSNNKFVARANDT